MNDKLEQLKELTKAHSEVFYRDHPTLAKDGLTLFLGTNYADQQHRIMMLGINPGGSGFKPDYKLQKTNCLVGNDKDDDARKFRYWRNARRCFGATDALSRAMSTATFTFCIPFRTPSWSNLPVGLRRSLTDCSRPILRRQFEDCRPRWIITAGKAAAGLVRDMYEWKRVGDVGTSGGWRSQKWRTRRLEAEWGEATLIQMPHFSRFSSREGLEICGEWLTGLICQTGASVDSI